MIKKGEVKAVKQRDKNYSILVDGKWYTGGGQCDVQQGQWVKMNVDHRHTDKGSYYWIKQIVEIPPELAQEKPEVEEMGSIEEEVDTIGMAIRTTTLQAAATMLAGRKDVHLGKTAVALAKQLEDYVRKGA